MFSKSSKTQSNASPMSATGAKHTPFSLIGGDVVITGDISATVDLHVDGTINGDIRCAALAQGPDSKIHGHVTAQSARLAGLVDGSITADELIIERTARITGDVTYDRITIETGGQVAGRFAHKSASGEGLSGELKLISSDASAA